MSASLKEEKSVEMCYDVKQPLVSNKKISKSSKRNNPNAFTVKNKEQNAVDSGSMCHLYRNCCISAQESLQNDNCGQIRPLIKFEPVDNDTMTPARVYKLMMDTINKPATISNLIANENTMRLIISDHLHNSIFEDHIPDTEEARKSFFLSVYNCDLFHKDAWV